MRKLAYLALAPLTLAAAAAIPFAAASASPAAPKPPFSQSCTTLSPAGNCYKPGQFCPAADKFKVAVGITGGKYDVIECVLQGGHNRWVQLPAASTAY